ncbi:MAG: 50S ribosomal protein L13 [Sporocytophaga sp.]|uniref:Large ribosomal subunit protein uL13 n=1 Tax=Sporocytophaga myxococcoides TaxID=153721 RepID=A0A098L895_9BACT|nr:50S ribosomal protein L13 [Sporocytophaga myxococcoides]MCR6638516.1 50S ribosomal protein L13 [Sporocytophaga sp.]GAL82870.1 50S ribosomal protein L13 [Sporocytophaga myxococcoides]
MDSISYRTSFATNETVKKDWVIVDAENLIVGRVASEIAKIIRGKHKASFTPNVDCGDNVIVINADKVRFTGKKFEDKVYTRHTGHPGGQRFTTPRELKNKSSRYIIENAVRGMLPKNRIGRAIFKNLYVYEGAEHPHAAQQPKVINL